LDEFGKYDARLLRRLALVCQITAAGISVIALFGWVTGVLFVAQAGSQFIPMAPRVLP
jgi:hypothetical protein